MTTQITEQQRKDYEEAFKLFDKNHDGKITSSELTDLFKTLGKNPTEEKIKSIIKSVDTDGNGSIEFDEFINMMASHAVCMDPAQEALVAFKIFDKNGDGYITPAELREVMNGLGEQISPADVDQMIREADLDGDGRINYQEFVTMMSGEK